MARHIKLLTLALLSTCFFVGNTQAQTEITQAMLDVAKLKIAEACPVRWQDVSEKLVIPADASEVIWEDATDRTEFVTYITTVIADSGSTADPQVLADDTATIAAECATKRTGLLDLLLIKEPNDVILGMRALKTTLEEQGEFSRDGSSQSLAAKSCKEIKNGYTDSADGVYWLDFDGGNSDNAVEAYCDMTSDGGGWTFVAYISGTSLFGSATSFFNQAYGTYDPSRVDAGDHFSLGVLPEMDDAEMIITFDTPEIQEADNQGDFLWLMYASTTPGFNYGPLPCTSSSFSFTKGLLDDNIRSGSDNEFTHCDSQKWHLKRNTSQLIYIRTNSTNSVKGVEQGSYVGGNDSAGHSAWFYVR